MLQHEKGFTLIELLIVLAIIGIMSAMSIPNLIMGLQRAKMNRTVADLKAMTTGLAAYMIDYGHYPISANLEEFREEILPVRYFSGGRSDAWGQRFRYVSDCTGENYALGSSGKNLHWNMPKPFDFKQSWSFRGPICRQFAYEQISKIINTGCDLFFVNGQLAGSKL